MPTTSGTTLIQRMVDLPEFGGYISGTTTAAGGAAAVMLTDTTNLQWAIALDQDRFRFSFVLITTLLHAAVDQVRQVQQWTPSTGELTVAPAFAGEIGNSVTYELYKAAPPTRYREFKGLLNYINDALEECWHEELGLLSSLITDADMETTGVTNWTASTATLSKATTEANVWRGAQSLRVLNTAAAGYAQSTTLNVVEGHTYLVAAYVRVASGTARLRVRDITGGANVDSVTSDERDWRILAYTWAPLANQLQAAIRLEGDESTADAYWDDLYVVDITSRRLEPPAWVSERNQFRGIVAVPFGAASAARGNFTAVQYTPKPVLGSFSLDQRSLRDFAVHLDQPPYQEAFHYMVGVRRYETLATLASTTTADRDLIATMARYLYWKDRGGIPGFEGETAMKRARFWGFAARNLQRALAPRNYAEWKDAFSE